VRGWDASLCDKAILGRPVTTTDKYNQEQVQEMISIEDRGHYVVN
jgi:hypothetical protein